MEGPPEPPGSCGWDGGGARRVGPLDLQSPSAVAGALPPGMGGSRRASSVTAGGGAQGCPRPPAPQARASPHTWWEPSAHWFPACIPSVFLQGQACLGPPIHTHTQKNTCKHIPVHPLTHMDMHAHAHRNTSTHLHTVDLNPGPALWGPWDTDTLGPSGLAGKGSRPGFGARGGGQWGWAVNLRTPHSLPMGSWWCGGWALTRV